MKKGLAMENTHLSTTQAKPFFVFNLSLRYGLAAV